ncbi:hypothetical protein [Oryza sativa Japonica Group]|uniref:Uncharacterized protein n=1 Tax=Oryza sativa subsp. japonica TaxID=39947 RepID=Q5JLW9_ORYSJ|nr:hypothetical protein [Oryza sativa Japonica Group]
MAKAVAAVEVSRSAAAALSSGSGGRRRKAISRRRRLAVTAIHLSLRVAPPESSTRCKL